METIKERRYYTVGEKVWLHTEKTLGIVKAIDKKSRSVEVEVTISHSDNTKIIRTVNVNFWEIDKARDPETYKNKRAVRKQSEIYIPVKYFDNDVEKIEKIEIGDWIDLRSREDVSLKQFENHLVKLNVAMELPEGYEAHVLPRSSTYNKWGIILANSKGIIDNSYAGDNDEWMFNAIALRDTEIKKGDRIAQFRIQQKMPKTEFYTVSRLGKIDRGGFGTTGTN